MRADRALSSDGNGDGNDAVWGVFSFGSVGRRVVVEATILSVRLLKRVSFGLVKE